MTRASLFVVVTAAMLAGCSSSSRIEQELPATLVEFAPEAQVRELWTADVGALGGKYDAQLMPVVDGNAVYVTNTGGLVQALARDTGRRLWQTNIDAPVTGATAVGDGLVVLGTRKGDVVALDAGNGERRWTGKVSSEVQAPAVIRQGFVVVQTVDGKLAGLNSSDGKRVWVFDRSEPALSLHGTGTPIIAAGLVLTGFANGKIVALQLKDGKLLWEHTVAPPRGRNEIERLVDVDAPVLLWGETLFAVAYQGKVIAVDMRSGRVVWTRDVSSYTSMDAGRGSLFIADEKGNVLAFDPQGGSNLWRQDKLHGRRLSGPTLHDDAVMVGDFEGYLHWLGRDDGRLVARYRLDSSAIRVRGIADGSTLYAASRGGRLAALQLVKN
jgi:outer membrane protein assembly factor BamB